MRVLVTVGTGFVGSHSVAALAAAGHEVRLLVRRSERIPPALVPLGLDGPVDHVVGDVTDAASVERAIAGCDAVLHAAAVYNLDTRADRETRATNVPARALLPATRLASTAQRVLPFRVPAEYEGALVCRHDTVIDDSRAREELGIEARPLAETLSDAVRWLHDAGHNRARHAGRVIDRDAQAAA